MALVDMCSNVARGIGAVAGRSLNLLAWFPMAVRKSAEKPRRLSSREKIRSVVIEELSRWVGKETELVGRKLEERLQVMAETMRALQKRVDELSARGPVSEADMWKEMSSLEVAASLTNGERAILVNVFRQNIALQKPELADAPVDESTS